MSGLGVNLAYIAGICNWGGEIVRWIAINNLMAIVQNYVNALSSII